MPSTYISVIRPPKWVFDELESKAKLNDMNIAKFTGIILTHALRNKALYDKTKPAVNSSSEELRKNLNITASAATKKAIDDWGNVDGRTLNQQTLNILKKYISLSLPIEELKN